MAERRWADAAALVLLGVGGVAAWWGALGDGLLWLAPVIAVAALTAAGALRVRAAMVIVILWLPGSIIAAGLGAGVIAPAALDTTATALHDGLEALPTIGAATPVMQVWALAAVLLIAGTTFGLAGILWRGAAWWRTLGGFAMLLVPLAGAVATQQTPDASWIGALVLVAVVLRIAHGRTIPIVATAGVVGAVALFGAQVAAPRAGWQPFGHSHLAQFHELDTAQTYGPLGDRRTGAVMLDVTAKQPALWRMQVLEAFDNVRWLVSREATHLPEPAATRTKATVEVRGLRNRSLVSPGRITAVLGTGGTLPEPGDARALLAEPKEGNVYTVEAATVHTTAARLATIPIPKGHQYEPLTQLGLGRPPRYIPEPLARLAKSMPAPLKGTYWGRLFNLSWKLSRGVESELKVVRRVEDYLLGGNRYHYTTEVGAPGREPLLEFLFHTHKGYCQHFAGAAALILRSAGVPTRVIVGFATGEPIGHDTYAVRDEDAHAWIEVYFPGVGWVPFNPTPSAAPADISAGIDVLRATAAGPTGAGGTALQLLGGAAAVALILFLAARLTRRGRAPRTPLSELLVRLAPEPSGPRTTLRSLHPTLTEIGPATADLALVAERSRFGAPAASADPPRPGWMVWRALVDDVGVRRATTLMLRAATAPNGA
ncbi:MAG: transglutaminase protein [Solirubrobacterales bacterium]|nr:transglutaminase protein [Solirubrobacterales bacterium]